MVVIMYFSLGYTNLYYHSFVFFLNAFIIFFLGYRSMQVWYERTYPLGRLGVPVAVLGLRGKIESWYSHRAHGLCRHRRAPVPPS